MFGGPHHVALRLSAVLFCVIAMGVLFGGVAWRSPPPPPSPSPRILILSLYRGPDASELAILTRPNKEAYAKHHGFLLRVNGRNSGANRGNRYAFIDAGSDPSCSHLLSMPNDAASARVGVMFAKLHLVRHFLRRFDWVFWSDADVVFANFSTPLTNFLPLNDQVDFVVAAANSQSQKWQKVINAGQYFLRNSTWSLQFLQAAIDLRLRGRPCAVDAVPYNGWLELCSGRCCLWEDQGAMILALFARPEWAHKVKYVGFREFNSMFPFWGTGDFAVHFFGQESATTRARLVRELLAAVDVTTGRVVADLSPALAPQSQLNHQRGLDYTAVNAAGVR